MNTPPPAVASGQEARDLLKSLQQKYPVFRECKPLAIGIDKQLLALEADLPRKTLRLALGMHTHSSRYLRAMEKADRRFNLDGSPGSEVPEEHRRHAADALRERARKEAERRQAEIRAKQEEAAEKRRAEKLNLLVQKYAR
ncbi:MAG: ProQ/FinO family protein [Candidatus Accumulibacter sp.]|jgi:ProP effector|nr:ProQ/FinO family protein [Accumulibacter sp.]